MKTPPKSSQKSYFLLLRETLKTYNLTTTDAIPMKLNRIMYLHETFHLGKNWGVTIRRKRAWSKNFWKPTAKWGFWVNFLEFSGLYQKPSSMWYIMLVWIAVPSFKRIWPNLGELWPKNHEKAPKNGIFCWLENIWKFITWQPQMLYLWNSPRLCISMRPSV